MSNERINQALDSLRSATRRLQRNDHGDPHITLANLALSLRLIHVADELIMAEYEAVVGLIQGVLAKHIAERPIRDAT